jgi:ferredoxin
VKIEVSELECAGHGRCALINEELFPLDEAGFSAIGELDVPDGLEADARAGVAACPSQAIKVLED